MTRGEEFTVAAYNMPGVSDYVDDWVGDEGESDGYKLNADFAVFSECHGAARKIRRLVRDIYAKALGTQIRTDADSMQEVKRRTAAAMRVHWDLRTVWADSILTIAFPCHFRRFLCRVLRCDCSHFDRQNSVDAISQLL